MMTDQGGALFSPCGKYRYRLWRRWDFNLSRACWIMLNPSTADASRDDATIRKCIGFTKRLGYGGIEVVNLFAWRATKPADMKRAADPIGPPNDAAIKNAAGSVNFGGGVVICAWGTHAGKSGRDLRVLDILEEIGVDPWVLGKLNKGGTPPHPLMLPYDTQLQEWVID